MTITHQKIIHPMKEHDLMDDELKRDERTLATIAHLGPFLGAMIPGLGNILLPFLIWFFKKDESDYIDRHAKEALNFQLSITVLLVAAGILIFLAVGIFILPVLVMVDIVFSVIAAIKANRGEFYQYPLNFNWIK